MSPIGYTLAPGGTMALTCTLDLYQETPEPGRYRLVKPVGGGAATAEFELGESPYTADRPYAWPPWRSCRPITAPPLRRPRTWSLPTAA